jgi:hypothetical protein
MQLHLKLQSAQATVHEMNSSRNVVLIEKVDRILFLSFSFMYSLHFICFWVDKYLQIEVQK